MLTSFKHLGCRSFYAAALLLGSFCLNAEVPTLTTPPVLELEFGKPFKYTIQASNDPVAYSVSGLPFWMKREGAVLHGTPVMKREHLLSLSASNLDGASEPKQLRLRVLDSLVSSAAQQVDAESSSSEN